MSVVICGDELSFNFVVADPAHTTKLRFLEVRNLTVVQPDGWSEGVADQIEHLLARSNGPWRSVVFKAGGIDCEFDCTELQVEILKDTGLK